MQPMDFFGNSGHVMMYCYRLLDGSGLKTVESTPAGWKDAAKYYQRVWSQLANYSCYTWWEAMTSTNRTPLN